LTIKNDEKWFILSIMMGALIACFYDFHQYWLNLLLNAVVHPTFPKFDLTIIVKLLAGFFSAMTGLLYYWIYKKYAGKPL
jgi:hypothetical protein